MFDHHVKWEVAEGRRRTYLILKIGSCLILFWQVRGYGTLGFDSLVCLIEILSVASCKTLLDKVCRYGSDFGVPMNMSTWTTVRIRNLLLWRDMSEDRLWSNFHLSRYSQLLPLQHQGYHMCPVAREKPYRLCDLSLYESTSYLSIVAISIKNKVLFNNSSMTKLLVNFVALRADRMIDFEWSPGAWQVILVNIKA